jgi:predicted RNA-binding Zn-ribbon protein involved in translation (DUF1610 family)
MGMYDTIIFKCSKCGTVIDCQTKLLGACNLDNFVVGDLQKEMPEEAKPIMIGSVWHEIMSNNKKLKNCIFKVKNSPCPNCGKENLIKIKNGVLKEVMNDINEEILAELGGYPIIEEGHWGIYKILK